MKFINNNSEQALLCIRDIFNVVFINQNYLYCKRKNNIHLGVFEIRKKNHLGEDHQISTEFD